MAVRPISVFIIMDSELENKPQEQSEEQKASGREGYKPSNYQRVYRPNSGKPQRPRINSQQRAYSSDRSGEGGFRPEGFGERLQSDNTQRKSGYRPHYSANPQQNGYQPRQQGGYRPRYGNDEQGGYKSRPQGGYRPRYGNDEQGGYQPRQQGGYRPRYGNDEQGGYQPRQQGGYRPRYGSDEQGGYQSRQQGGYRPRYNEGGYQPRQQGGYGSQYGGGYPQGGNRPKPNRVQKAKPNLKKRIDYKEVDVDPDAPLRLNKFLANAGVCSRREADDFITAGVVSVNGVVVTELGTKVKRSDEVLFHDQIVKLEKKVYVLLNKPKDYVTTSDDPQQRKTVMDLVKDACNERIYPVGRLDRNTTGVLLLTNDGELASKLTHPKFLKKKIYHVFLDKKVTAHDMQQIADGVKLEDGEVHADAIEYADEQDKTQVGIEIHSGKNRIVRRIFESLGYRVVKLDRVQFAGLTKKGVRRGDWRYLTEKEVDILRMGAFE